MAGKHDSPKTTFEAPDMNFWCRVLAGEAGQRGPNIIELKSEGFGDGAISPLFDDHKTSDSTHARNPVTTYEQPRPTQSNTTKCARVTVPHDALT